LITYADGKITEGRSGNNIKRGNMKKKNIARIYQPVCIVKVFSSFFQGSNQKKVQMKAIIEGKIKQYMTNFFPW
jgi:hypothetical protein